MSYSLSVSKTKTFLDCKAKFKFCYIEKLPRKEQDFHIFGKFVHRVLELFHKEYLDGSKDHYNTVMGKCYKIAMSEFALKMTTEARAEGYKIVDEYLKKIYDKTEIAVDKVVAVEKEFKLDICEDVRVVGFIDRIQTDKDGVLHVCDYKTSKSKKYLKDDYFQLLTYAYILLQENPELKTIRGSYIMMRHNFDYITKDFSVDEILTVKDMYIDYFNKIKDEKLFRPSPSPLCKYCDYLESCAAGKEQVGNAFNGTNFGLTKWI